MRFWLKQDALFCILFLDRFSWNAESRNCVGPRGHERIRNKFNLPNDIVKSGDYISQPGDEGYIDRLMFQTKSHERLMNV